MNNSPIPHHAQGFATGRPLEQPVAAIRRESFPPAHARRWVAYVPSTAAVQATSAARRGTLSTPSPPLRAAIDVQSVGAPKRKLLDQVRDAIRTRHYSYRTEEAYVGWIKCYIFFHGKRHPAEMGKPEIEQFVTALAVERNVAASTQNQALAAILFLYIIRKYSAATPAGLMTSCAPSGRDGSRWC